MSGLRTISKIHGKSIVCIVIFLIMLSMYLAEELLRIKRNYTELHRKVDNCGCR